LTENDERGNLLNCSALKEQSSWNPDKISVRGKYYEKLKISTFYLLARSFSFIRNAYLGFRKTATKFRFSLKLSGTTSGSFSTASIRIICEFNY
jgi:hypothetical protein